MQSSVAPSLREQRAAARFESTLPLRMAGCTGATLNVSHHGVYFETAWPQRVGSLVEFTLEYRLQGRTQRLACEAKVLRVERRGAGYGVAARLLAPLFVREEIEAAR